MKKDDHYILLDVNGRTDTKLDRQRRLGSGVPRKKCYGCNRAVLNFDYFSLLGHGYCTEHCFVHHTGRY